METVERIDKILVKRNIARSRQSALEMVLRGQVSVNGKIVDKISQKFSTDSEVLVSGSDLEWASRGGLKLKKALENWKIDVSSMVCLDIGASTGGFTDVLLNSGAKKVYAVDVGHDQLVERLKKDQRVINLEGVNIKNLDKNDIPEMINFIVIDVSFISLTQVLQHAIAFLSDNGKIIALIKPQFEIGKEKIKKTGIVKKPEFHKEVIEKIRDHIKTIGLFEIGLIESPPTKKGNNLEFLIFLKK